MTERHRRQAHNVVQSFKELLPESAVRALTETEFEELEDLIQEALSEELHYATEQTADVVRRLRSEVELPELGL